MTSFLCLLTSNIHLFHHTGLGDLTGFSPRMIVLKPGFAGYSDTLDKAAEEIGRVRVMSGSVMWCGGVRNREGECGSVGCVLLCAVVRK